MDIHVCTWVKRSSIFIGRGQQEAGHNCYGGVTRRGRGPSIKPLCLSKVCRRSEGGWLVVSDHSGLKGRRGQWAWSLKRNTEKKGGEGRRETYHWHDLSGGDYGSGIDDHRHAHRDKLRRWYGRAGLDLEEQTGQKGDEGNRWKAEHSATWACWCFWLDGKNVNSRCLLYKLEDPSWEENSSQLNARIIAHRVEGVHTDSRLSLPYKVLGPGGV
jgi:hypothetical protein